MRHPKATIAVLGVAAAAGISGIAAAATGGGSSVTAASSRAASVAKMPATTTPATPAVTPATPAVTPATPAVAPATPATVHTLSTTVTGNTETVLVDAQGLPLYFYKPDTATQSFVTGGLASLWPPLVAARPSISGATGKVTMSTSVHGGQVAYNGHFLYTFVGDSPGHVSGQGVQNFFVATPGLAAITTSKATTTPMVPASTSGGIYGY
jgi:predicted lipoprotein with Yx(FWY)xxD motif